LRDMPEGAVEVLQNAIAQLDDSVLLIVTADELKKDSKIRKLYEDSKQLTALLCYKEDGQNLRKTVAGFFAKNQVTLGRDCIEYLCANLGDDKLVTENELEKIMLYLGNQKTLEVDDLMQVLADNSEMALSEIAAFVAARSPLKLEKTLAKAFAENASGVAIIRAVIWHFNRLILVKKLQENNMTLESAMATLRPPVFFKQVDSFKMALGKWSTARLEKAIERLTALEKEVKSSTLDQDIICRDLLIKLAA
jgi:DNA polymerase-3 subunit delta